MSTVEARTKAREGRVGGSGETASEGEERRWRQQHEEGKGVVAIGKEDASAGKERGEGGALGRGRERELLKEWKKEEGIRVWVRVWIRLGCFELEFVKRRKRKGERW